MTQPPAFKIAVIAGDGIGKEVMPEGLRVLRRRRHSALACSCDMHPHRLGQLRLLRRSTAR
ncbi:MAG: hypothetical protein V9G23_14975 [Giesbergeria sp.]